QQQKNNKSKSPQFSQIWVTFNFEATGTAIPGDPKQLDFDCAKLSVDIVSWNCDIAPAFNPSRDLPP
ncbi:hypothetical protein L6R21_08250, partial [bacterium]|nr:hypothetical protein [bacterium]